MRKTEILAYAAGIIDGEGCIRVSRHNPQGNRGILEIYVSNTNEWLCYWLQSQFGGNVYTQKSINPLWKRAYRWRLASNYALEFLRLILPYLQIKKQHAEIVIKFQERRIQGKHKSEGQRAIEFVELELLSKLNKRGTA